MKKIFITLSIVTFTIMSCSKDSESSISPTPTPTPTPSADGKSHYANDVAPIINSKCLSCHGNPPGPGPMSLTTFDLVKDAVLNRGLINRISLPQGDPSLMPKGGTRLAQSDIDKIVKWQTDGFLQ